jgi:hypothetical protein
MPVPPAIKAMCSLDVGVRGQQTSHTLFVQEHCSLKERSEDASWSQDVPSSATSNEQKGYSGSVHSDRVHPCSVGTPLPRCVLDEMKVSEVGSIASSEGASLRSVEPLFSVLPPIPSLCPLCFLLLDERCTCRIGACVKEKRGKNVLTVYLVSIGTSG